MPARSRIAVAGLIVLLLAAAMFSAGCARNQGQDAPAPSPAAPTGTGAAAVKTTPSAAPTAPVTQGTSVKTCSGLGGTVTGAGQTCPGTYLPASDSFSCCSVKPAGGATAGAVLTIEPFSPSAEEENFTDITG